MERIFLIILATVCLIAGAISHENDIARACEEYGNSGLAGWTINITCSVKH